MTPFVLPSSQNREKKGKSRWNFSGPDAGSTSGPRQAGSWASTHGSLPLMDRPGCGLRVVVPTLHPPLDLLSGMLCCLRELFDICFKILIVGEFDRQEDDIHLVTLCVTGELRHPPQSKAVALGNVLPSP